MLNGEKSGSTTKDFFADEGRRDGNDDGDDSANPDEGFTLFEFGLFIISPTRGGCKKLE